ncbi:hypothetical protein GQ44DRAFT_741037 [Phaeosphaeriaceae sp. PMI808]|nr:hypothetical protein GQ44DRAFT_741037 [Phaeosphaeriaceae sp. PMI808]
MSPSSESKSSKRRTGRKRQPPLAPPPSIQFVIAGHPDEFKDGTTMRNIRSHVMYKHRESRGSSPLEKGKEREGSSTPASLRRTSSSMATSSSEGVLDDSYFLAPTPTRPSSTVLNQEFYNYTSVSPATDPRRTLTARIISATDPARSASPMFQEALESPFIGNNVSGHESLESLKQEYIHSTDFFCHDMPWMHNVCANRLSFLSHVSVTCVYQDLAEGYLYDSDITSDAKTKVLRAITDDPLEIDDVTILSISNLLVSGIGGSFDDEVFDVHSQGLMRIVSQRGGISNLHQHIATNITLILNDMQNLTQTYLTRWRCVSDLDPASNAQVPACDAQIQQIYIRLLAYHPTGGDMMPDWIYESCRLAAILYCSSIVHGSSLAESGETIYAHSTSPDLPSTTLLSALNAAVMQTDTRSCWGDMRGVFLWVCLVGGAASWPQSQFSSGEIGEEVSLSQLWARKYFALFTIRAAVSVPFDQTGNTIQALRTMLHVRHWMDLNNGAQRASR